MIERLGTGVVYHWLCLIAWSTRNRTSGDFYGLTVEHIELHAKWPAFVVKSGCYKGRRSRGLLVETFSECGFFDSDDKGYKWHEWDEHQPYVSKEDQRIAASKAANDAKRQKKLMEAQKAAAQAERLAEEFEAVTGNQESGDRKPEERSRPFPSLPNQSIPEPSKPLPPDGGQRTRASRIPDDFKVEQHHREFARAQGLVSPDLEIGAFRDYWKAKPGKDGVKLDWNATFRNWLRNSRRGVVNEKPGTAAVSKAQQRQDSNIDAARDAISRIRGVDCRAGGDTSGSPQGNCDQPDFAGIREGSQRPAALPCGGDVIEGTSRMRISPQAEGNAGHGDDKP